MKSPGDARYAKPSAPERVPHPLLAIVLVNALDAVRARRRGPALRRAREWICTDEAPGTLGFERTCRDLALDPVVIRRRIGLRRTRGRHVSHRGLLRSPSA
jgi:hypothetical protein